MESAFRLTFYSSLIWSLRSLLHLFSGSFISEILTVYYFRRSTQHAAGLSIGCFQARNPRFSPAPDWFKSTEEYNITRSCHLIATFLSHLLPCCVMFWYRCAFHCFHRQRIELRHFCCPLLPVLPVDFRFPLYHAFSYLIMFPILQCDSFYHFNNILTLSHAYLLY